MSKLDILRRSVAQHQPSHQWVSTIVWDQFQEMRWVTLCLQSGPGRCTLAIVLFVAAFKSGFHPRPLVSRSHGPAAQPSPPSTHRCQQTVSLATVTVTVAIQHFTLLSASQRKKGYWWLLLFASLSSLILKQIWTTYSNFADEIVKRRKRGGRQRSKNIRLIFVAE